jgi:hypothetical protein
MAVGTDPFAQAPFGVAAIAESPRVTPAPAPPAKLFDPNARDFLLNSDGHYTPTHPVDQWVVIQLTYIAGTMPANSAVGNPVLQITHIADDHIPKVETLIRKTLDPKVSAGEVRISSIVVETSAGRTPFQVDYMNLVTGRPNSFRSS